MADKSFDEITTCFDDLETCSENCTGWHCIHVDFCNDLVNKYACLPIDGRFLKWLSLGFLLLVFFCCLLLILCYTCWVLRIRIRNPIPTNYKVTFENRLPVGISTIHV